MKNSDDTSRVPGIWTKLASDGRDPAGRRQEMEEFAGYGREISKRRREAMGSGRDGMRKLVPRESRVSRNEEQIIYTKNGTRSGGIRSGSTGIRPGLVHGNGFCHSRPGPLRFSGSRSEPDRKPRDVEPWFIVIFSNN